MTPSVAYGDSSPKGEPYGDAAKFSANTKAVPLGKVAANVVSRRKGFYNSLCISTISAQKRLGQWVMRPFSLWRALISSVL